MSVPLDRLYNFLHGVCNHDVIIYRFFPHGSKKLEDLIPLTHIDSIPWLEKMTTPCVIFHDQEPLDYNLYTDKDFASQVKETDCYFGLADIIVKMHLRGCASPAFNGYDQVLLCHSEKNSKEVELYKTAGFVDVYYWSHALIARDWFRFAEIDPGLTINTDNISTDFLIYNRAWAGTREYRLTFFELLANNNLIANCNISFSEYDNCRYTEHLFVNPSLQINRQDLHQIGRPNTHNSCASADYDNTDYSTSAIEVVLETLFDDQRVHLTEKVLRPIACGRPFILASTPGALKYLQSYGFRTFDGLIDETYDTIVDPKQRLDVIVAEMQRISNLSHTNKTSLWNQLNAIAAENKKLFFSNNFQDQVILEFKDNFASAFSQLTKTGKYWKMLEQRSVEDVKLHNKFHNPLLSKRSTEDLLIFKSWLTSN